MGPVRSGVSLAGVLIAAVRLVRSAGSMVGVVTSAVGLVGAPVAGRGVLAVARRGVLGVARRGVLAAPVVGMLTVAVVRVLALALWVAGTTLGVLAATMSWRLVPGRMPRAVAAGVIGLPLAVAV